MERSQDAVTPAHTTVEVKQPKELTTIYKKNGSFDKQRKLLLENFKTSETHSNLLMKLKLLIDGKIKANPEILLKNKGKTGALIQGEIINEHINDPSKGNTLLSIVDKDIQEKIIDSPEFLLLLKDELRDVKRKLEGISDEEYEKLLAKEKELELEREREKERERERINERNKDIREPPFYGNKFSGSYRPKVGRITKVPRFNFREIPKSSKDELNGEDKKDDKKKFLLY